MTAKLNRTRDKKKRPDPFLFAAVVICACTTLGGDGTRESSRMADKRLPDRTDYWIATFDRRGTEKKGDEEDAAPPIKTSANQLKSFREETIAQLDREIKARKEPWDTYFASEVYRKLVRCYWLGERDDRRVRSIAPSILPKNELSTIPRPATPHPILGWKPTEYSIVQSPHFEIATQGSLKLAVPISAIAEQTFSLWQQIFVAAWIEPSDLEKVVQQQEDVAKYLTSNNRRNIVISVDGSNRGGQLKNRNGMTGNSEQHVAPKLQIVVFRTRENYLDYLQSIESKIDVSTGFYHLESQCVYCYWEEGTTESVLIHEICHQLFNENSRWKSSTFASDDPSYWILEGIAMYLESAVFDLATDCDRATVGGWDTQRLQPARYRRLHDEYWIPWNEFRKARRSAFQSGEEVRQYYSQSVGLTHLWMDSSRSMRASMIDYLTGIYDANSMSGSGPKSKDSASDDLRLDKTIFSDKLPSSKALSDVSQGDSVSMSEMIAIDDEQLRLAYDKFLMQPADWLREIPARPAQRDLVLSRVPIASADIPLLSKNFYRRQQWLDLSFTACDDRVWSGGLPSPWDLQRLSLEGTRITDASVLKIAKIKSLQELDLSACKVSDEGLKAIERHPNLRRLWLSDTSVTDKSIDVLMSLPRLEEIDIRGTQMTEQGLRSFIKKRPKIRQLK